MSSSLSDWPRHTGAAIFLLVGANKSRLPKPTFFSSFSTFFLS